MKRLTTIKNALSHEECQSMIERLEQLGFHQQHSGDGDRVIRTRCVFEDRNFAQKIWPRLSPHIGALVDLYGEGMTPEPATHRPLNEFQPVGLNELLRCYKYRPGEQFRRHEDFAHEWSHSKRTFLTVLFYLNDNFEGGETQFETTSVEPQTGLAAVFPHELEHAGRPVDSGIKYALRSDVVFSCQ